jgi:hypothetical protein
MPLQHWNRSFREITSKGGLVIVPKREIEQFFF